MLQELKSGSKTQGSQGDFTNRTIHAFIVKFAFVSVGALVYPLHL